MRDDRKSKCSLGMLSSPVIVDLNAGFSGLASSLGVHEWVVPCDQSSSSGAGGEDVALLTGSAAMRDSWKDSQ